MGLFYAPTMLPHHHTWYNRHAPTPDLEDNSSLPSHHPGHTSRANATLTPVIIQKLLVGCSPAPQAPQRS